MPHNLSLFDLPAEIQRDSVCLPAPVSLVRGEVTNSSRDVVSQQDYAWREAMLNRVPFTAIVVYRSSPLVVICTHFMDVGNGKRKGRPPVHANNAARKRAHRASKKRVDFADDPAIVQKLEEIAAAIDCSVADLMRSMVRVALTNRNWKQLGLYGSKAH